MPESINIAETEESLEEMLDVEEIESEVQVQAEELASEKERQTEEHERMTMRLESARVDLEQGTGQRLEMAQTYKCVVREDATGKRRVFWNDQEISSEGMDEEGQFETLCGAKSGYVAYHEFKSCAVVVKDEVNEWGERETEYMLVQFREVPVNLNEESDEWIGSEDEAQVEQVEIEAQAESMVDEISEELVREEVVVVQEQQSNEVREEEVQVIENTSSEGIEINYINAMDMVGERVEVDDQREELEEQASENTINSDVFVEQRQVEEPQLEEVWNHEELRKELLKQEEPGETKTGEVRVIENTPSEAIEIKYVNAGEREAASMPEVVQTDLGQKNESRKVEVSLQEMFPGLVPKAVDVKADQVLSEQSVTRVKERVEVAITEEKKIAERPVILEKGRENNVENIDVDVNVDVKVGEKKEYPKVETVYKAEVRREEIQGIDVELDMEEKVALTLMPEQIEKSVMDLWPVEERGELEKVIRGAVNREQQYFSGERTVKGEVLDVTVVERDGDAVRYRFYEAKTKPDSLEQVTDGPVGYEWRAEAERENWRNEREKPGWRVDLDNYVGQIKQRGTEIELAAEARHRGGIIIGTEDEEEGTIRSSQITGGTTVNRTMMV